MSQDWYAHRSPISYRQQLWQSAFLNLAHAFLKLQCRGKFNIAYNVNWLTDWIKPSESVLGRVTLYGLQNVRSSYWQLLTVTDGTRAVDSDWLELIQPYSLPRHYNNLSGGLGLVGIDSALFILPRHYNNLRVVDSDWLELIQPYLLPPYYNNLRVVESDWLELIQRYLL